MAFSSFLAKLQAWWTKRQTYFATVNELSQLSDRELGDLGISRCDIEFVAKSAVAA